MVLTTDNGGVHRYGGYNFPLRGEKHTLWEGGLRGISFVHGNMLGRRGVRCKELLHVTDWYPTLVNLVGTVHVLLFLNVFCIQSDKQLELSIWLNKIDNLDCFASQWHHQLLLLLHHSSLDKAASTVVAKMSIQFVQKWPA